MSACERCSSPFAGRPAQRFCSELCRKRAERARARGRVVRLGVVRDLVCRDCRCQLARPIRPGPVPSRCDACTSKARKVRNAERASTAPVIECLQCRRSFLRKKADGNNRRFCRQACRVAWVLAHRGASPYGGMRRARSRGVAVEKFFPIEILERDRWTCQRCGDPTPRSLRGTSDPKAPEVDHVIPLGLGPHSRENCQCLCRSCNIKKGAKVP